MRMVAAVAVAAFLIAGFLVLRERASPRGARPVPDEAAPAPGEPVPPPEDDDFIVSEAFGGEGAPFDDEEQGGGRGREAPAWEEIPAEPAPPRAPGPVVLAGTLTVEGDGGAPTGTFRLTWTGLQGYDEAHIEVRAGAWSATVPSDATLAFDEVLLGGRRAVALEQEQRVPASGEVAVRCRWSAPTVLRAVDDATGRELSGIEVVRYEGWLDEHAIHPGPASEWGAGPVASDATSPLTLPEAEGKQVYWVRAPEHAWTRVEVEQSFGGGREVRLPRAGVLDVRLDNFDPRSRAEVRLYDETGGHRLSWLSGPARIESLAPGRYRVRVEQGDWFRTPLCLGQEVVEVEAGATRVVTVALARALGPEDVVPLSGTLQVDPGWGDTKDVRLWVGALDVAGGGVDMPLVTWADGNRWDAGRVLPGRYAIHVDPWTWRQEVDVGPGGNTEVRIVVPPPCDLEVQVLEAGSDALVPLEKLGWRSGGGTLRTEEAEEPGRFRFRAPVGTIAFLADGEFVVNAPAIPLNAGLNRLQVMARRSCGVTIVLEDAATGARVPMPDGFAERVTLGGIDDPECRSANRHGVEPFATTFGVTKPGRYRIVFGGEIEGYAPLNDTEVTVPKTGNAKLVLRLRRKE